MSTNLKAYKDQLDANDLNQILQGVVKAVFPPDSEPLGSKLFRRSVGWQRNKYKIPKSAKYLSTILSRAKHTIHITTGSDFRHNLWMNQEVLKQLRKKSKSNVEILILTASDKIENNEIEKLVDDNSNVELKHWPDLPNTHFVVVDSLFWRLEQGHEAGELNGVTSMINKGILGGRIADDTFGKRLDDVFYFLWEKATGKPVVV